MSRNSNRSGLGSGMPLSLPAAEIQKMGDQVTSWIVEYFSHLEKLPVYPGVLGETVRSSFQEPLPEEGQSWEGILEEFRSKVVPNCRINSHPRFFGYVSGAGTPPAVFADLLASAINQNVTSWRSAPAGTEIERLVVEWLCQMLDLPVAWDGYLTSGGSLANLIALAVARCTKFEGDLREEGVNGNSAGRKMILYASSEVHGSILRGAELLGLGRRQVRTVSVDEHMRMDLRDLRRQVQLDTDAGHQPFCVAANAGSVNTGAVDPLADIAEICRQHNLWLHVDGSYGALAMLAPGAKQLFDGMGQADSISVDPHKWLYVPIDAGCVLFANLDRARETFTLDADYMKVQKFSDDREGFAFFDYGPEVTRRFRALRIWVSLKYFGTRAIAEQIGKNIRVAAYLRRRISQSDDFQLLWPGPLGIACFRYIPKELRRGGAPTTWEFSEDEELLVNRLNNDIIHELQHQGRFYPSLTTVKGRTAIRVCLVNYLVDESDMDALLVEISGLAVRIVRDLA